MLSLINYAYAVRKMVIVDLYTQRDAVAAQLRQIEPSEKLDWLRERGELTESSAAPPSTRAFRFCSYQGIVAVFLIRDGKMIFVGDHTLADAVKIGDKSDGKLI